jgi:mannose/cellobiose epimerase-like protein (N-acyl-D-glucosamine 2-epimerase family)
MWKRLQLIAAMLVIAAVAGAAEAPEIGHRLPSGEQWLIHVMRDLLPYWSSTEALGEPVGRFPTFRYSDGAAVIANQRLRPDYLEVGDWIALRLDRIYPRMVSRQIYALAVGYHLTGDGRYLAMARAGLDWLLTDMVDESGSFCGWIEDGRCAPAGPQRTAQDLAYALLGPAMMAYLTRDPELIELIVEAQKDLFAGYRDTESGLLRWVLEPIDDPPDRHEPEQLELVAQLDQINAYLLLMAPLIPQPDAARWRDDLAATANVLVERFYDQQHNVFWGRIDAPEFRRLGGHHHTDTGHTAKAFWMLSRVSRLTGDQAMEQLARSGGARLLDEVFFDEYGTWSSGWTDEGLRQEPAIWWAHAELDQLAASLALADPSLARRLPRSYDFWFTYFVDHRHGGTWSFPVEPEKDPPHMKANLWKNGYHAAEHALVAYLTGNTLRGEPVTLFFAPLEGTDPADLRPYLFEGAPEVVRRTPLGQLDGHDRLEVRFTGLK